MACGWCPPTGRNICGGTAARPMTLSQGPNTMNDEPKRRAPILDHADHAAPSVFAPQALLREARRQKGIAEGQVPRFCVLDPDGDLVRYLKRGGRIVTRGNSRSCSSSSTAAKTPPTCANCFR